MKIILTLGPCSGELYDVPDHQETVVIEFADVNGVKVKELDRVEYVRTKAEITFQGTRRVVFTLKRTLPGRPV